MTALTDGCTARGVPGDRVGAARGAERAGRLAEAEALYREAVAENSGSPAAALSLVRLLDARGDRRGAEHVLRSFVAAARTSASVTAAARQWEAWQDSPRTGAVTVRVALTGSGTLGPLGAHLRVACAQAGIHPVIYVSDFGQWAQDILVPLTPLYNFAPDVIVLLLAGSALFPRTILDPEADPDALEAERARGLAEIGALIDALRRNAVGASLVVHTFSLPDRSPFGLLDLKQDLGQRARVEALNAALVALVRDRPEVLLFDQDRVEARHGKSRVRDDRLWYVAGNPFSESFLPVMAAEYIRIIRPLKGLVRKCIILDLDETLWGGVVGEDGLQGITLGGNDAPGNAYYDFQIALDGLRRRGVLLALCSKNNAEEVWPVIDGHPHMVLRRDHFVAARVNWRDKASNILEISRELNLGVDSIVFLDDNPAERALVRRQLPDVLTVELPADPAHFARTLLELDVFESLGLTKEDRHREEMYRQSRARREHEDVRTAPSDLRTHLESLQIEVAIRSATPFSMARIAQLVNKTNQFNLTTRRYTETQVRAMAEAADRWAVYSVNVADRFGDLGLTGVALVQVDSQVWVIDSFLLSCRVLGRGIEDALLAHIVARAKAAGARALQGIFIPTARNAPARGLYSERGFRPVGTGQEADGPTVFELSLDLAEARTEHVSWLRITEADDER